MKPTFRHLIMLCGAVMFSHSIIAQTDTAYTQSDWAEIRLMHIARQELNMPNPAGMLAQRRTPISEARLTIRNDNGGFAPYFEQPKALTLQADVEAYHPLSSRVMLYGRIGYKNIAARHAAASALLSPERMPFGIVEDSLTNSGRKHTDVYTLHGGVAARLWRGISAGARMDFLAANYAKYKDLRHKNSVMDMSITAGIRGEAGRNVALGLDLRYRRYTESIRFAIYGNSDKVYKSLIDYGGFMGKIEQYGEYGYTDASREMPFLSEHFGIDVQAEWHLSRRLSTTHSAGTAYRKGYYGKRSSYTISYNQHRSHLYTWQASLKYTPTRAIHLINWSLNTERLANHSNSYRSALDPATGASRYDYYTPVKLSDRVWADLDVHYHSLLGISKGQPTWEIKAGYTRRLLKQTAYVYPYFRRQNITSHRWYAETARITALGSGYLRMSVLCAFGKGHGAPYTDGTLTTPSDRQTPPPEMQTYLYRDYIYRTAPYSSTVIAARYTLPTAKLIPTLATTGSKIYAEARFSLAKANTHSAWIDDRYCRTACITVGYIF